MILLAMAASRSGKLRALMKHECVALPGAFNGFVGRMVAEHGFKGSYISGAALTASAGVPDIGLLTLDHFTRVIKEVVQVSDLPLIADADTGFGEAEMVTRTVQEYHAAGAAGLHIEDQVFPKRCGHLDGKALVSKEAFVDKVARARAAANACSGGEFIICARTDAAGVTNIDDAIDRATAYVHAGADMIFPEGLHTKDDFFKFAEAMRKLPGPAPNGGPFMLANMTEFGKTPYLPVSEFASLGFHCVIFPVSTFRSAMGGVNELLKTLKESGATEPALDKMYTRQQLYGSLQYTPGQEWTFPSVSKPVSKL
jgi:methylisocitrate lyase